MDKLPPLKKVLKKREADHTRAVLEWFRNSYLGGSVALEIKYCKGNSLGQSALQPHQRAALRAAASGGAGAGLIHKLSDEVRRQQPFDAFMIRGAAAFVVVVFGGREAGGLRCAAWPVVAWAGAHRDDDTVVLSRAGGFIFHI